MNPEERQQASLLIGRGVIQFEFAVEQGLKALVGEFGADALFVERVEAGGLAMRRGGQGQRGEQRNQKTFSHSCALSINEIAGRRPW